MINRLQRIASSPITFIILLACGLVIVGLIALGYRSNLQNSYHLEGAAEFDRAYILLSERVGTYIYGLQGLGGVYLISNFKPTPQQIRKYAEFRGFFANFSGVLGFGFVRSVPRSEMKSYVKAQQALHPGYDVQFLGQSESELNLMVVDSIEPVESNARALGREMNSEKFRREALTRAIETGEASLTRSVNLVQLTQDEKGFLFFLPIYKGGFTPLTLEERRHDIVGLVFAPIVGSAIQKYLARRVSHFLHYAVYEDTNSPELNKIFGGTSFDGEADYERPLTIGGQKWILKAQYHKAETAEMIRVLPWFLFIFLSALFLGMCFFVRRLLMAHPTKI